MDSGFPRLAELRNNLRSRLSQSDVEARRVSVRKAKSFISMIARSGMETKNDKGTKKRQLSLTKETGDICSLSHD